jgi:hypothetical protein
LPPLDAPMALGAVGGASSAIIGCDTIRTQATTVLAGATGTIGNFHRALMDGHSLLADADANRWPDAVDAAALSFWLLIAFGLPALGYVFMVIDIRGYLRSLRRALVVVTSVVTRRGAPYWAVRDRPPCLQTFDLDLPCTEEQVLAAYRRRVKELHPDRGGDLQQFLRLQKHFEQAQHLVRAHAARAKIRTVSVE